MRSRRYMVALPVRHRTGTGREAGRDGAPDKATPDLLSEAGRADLRPWA
jgi:hypothetical protein